MNTIDLMQDAPWPRFEGMARIDLNVPEYEKARAAVNATYGAGIKPEGIKGLVDALELLVDDALTDSDADEGHAPKVTWEAVEKARAAIAKAKGVSP